MADKKIFLSGYLLAGRSGSIKVQADELEIKKVRTSPSDFEFDITCDLDDVDDLKDTDELTNNGYIHLRITVDKEDIYEVTLGDLAERNGEYLDLDHFKIEYGRKIVRASNLYR